MNRSLSEMKTQSERTGYLSNLMKTTQYK